MAENVDGLALGGHRPALGKRQGAQHAQHLLCGAPARKADGRGFGLAGGAQLQVRGQGREAGARVQQILHRAIVETVLDPPASRVGGLGVELAEQGVRALHVAGLAGRGELREDVEPQIAAEVFLDDVGDGEAILEGDLEGGLVVPAVGPGARDGAVRGAADGAVEERLVGLRGIVKRGQHLLVHEATHGVTVGAFQEGPAQRALRQAEAQGERLPGRVEPRAHEHHATDQVGLDDAGDGAAEVVALQRARGVGDVGERERDVRLREVRRNKAIERLQNHA